MIDMILTLLHLGEVLPDILLTKTIIIRSGPILKVTCCDVGGHFESCPLWNVFLSIGQFQRG